MTTAALPTREQTLAPFSYDRAAPIPGEPDDDALQALWRHQGRGAVDWLADAVRTLDKELRTAVEALKSSPDASRAHQAIGDIPPRRDAMARILASLAKTGKVKAFSIPPPPTIPDVVQLLVVDEDVRRWKSELVEVEAGIRDSDDELSSVEKIEQAGQPRGNWLSDERAAALAAIGRIIGLGRRVEQHTLLPFRIAHDSLAKVSLPSFPHPAQASLIAVLERRSKLVRRQRELKALLDAADGRNRGRLQLVGNAVARAVAEAGGAQAVTSTVRNALRVTGKWFEPHPLSGELAGFKRDLALLDDRIARLDVDGGDLLRVYTKQKEELAARVGNLEATIDAARRSEVEALLRLAVAGDESARAGIQAVVDDPRTSGGFKAGFGESLAKAEFSRVVLAELGT
jgi:hypothetical protein